MASLADQKTDRGMNIEFRELESPVFGVAINGKFTGFAELIGEAADLVNRFSPIIYTDATPYFTEPVGHLPRFFTGFWVVGPEYMQDLVTPFLVQLNPTYQCGMVFGNQVRCRQDGNRTLQVKEKALCYGRLLTEFTALVDYSTGEFIEPVTVRFKLKRVHEDNILIQRHRDRLASHTAALYNDPA